MQTSSDWRFINNIDFNQEDAELIAHNLVQQKALP